MPVAPTPSLEPFVTNAERRGDTHERVPPDHPLAEHVWVNHDRMGGEPCFKGSRVPIDTLLQHLRAGDPLDEFLDGFPPVTREQAIAVTNFVFDRLIDELRDL